MWSINTVCSDKKKDNRERRKTGLTGQNTTVEFEMPQLPLLRPAIASWIGVIDEDIFMGGVVKKTLCCA